jgi:hypothetical protein
MTTNQVRGVVVGCTLFLLVLVGSMCESPLAATILGAMITTVGIGLVVSLEDDDAWRP